MSTKSIVIEHNGKKYDGTIATIESTYLGNGEDSRGVLSTWLHCGWSGGGIGVGGYTLDSYNEATKKREPGVMAGLYVAKIMETAGVESWEKLKNTRIIVLFKEGESGWGGTAAGFAGLLNDKVLIHEEFFSTYKKEN